FTEIETMENVRAANLMKEANEFLAGDKKTFGYATSVKAYSYELKNEDDDLVNQLKQLNIAKAGMFKEDLAEFKETMERADKLTDYLFQAIESYASEREVEYDTARDNLIADIKGIKKDKRLRLYKASHSDEDGSWQILNVLDEKNKQVLLIKVG